MKNLHIKVDVDTFKGMREGVPSLVRIFREHGIKATFFISMGPDNSGKAIRRIFTKKGFLKKMLRTNAASVYGFPTLLYGTILPPPEIALKNREIFDLLKQEGHEIGVHGHDHVRWHDLLPRMSEAEITGEFSKAFTNYENIVKVKSLSFAAPGWSWSQTAQKLIENLEIVYTSNTRGEGPFFPAYENKSYGVLEIPSTLPTLDEVMGVKVKDRNRLTEFYIEEIKRQQNAVFTIHAELEGMAYSQWFSDLLGRLRSEGEIIQPLIAFAKSELAQKERVPSCEIWMKEIDGRAGKVAVQGRIIKKYFPP